MQLYSFRKYKCALNLLCKRHNYLKMVTLAYTLQKKKKIHFYV